MVGMKAGRFGAMLERMSDRERKLVLGGGAMLLVVLIVLVGVLVARRVSALEEQVTANEESLGEIVAAGPAYLRMRQTEKTLQDQLERASKESLQSTVLAIAKTIQYERRAGGGDEGEGGGGTVTERLSDVVKFSNATEILAELTAKQKKGAKRKPTKKAKGGQQVFLASIDAVFQGVPDEPLMRFLAKLETHPEPLFGISVDLTRTSPSRDQFQATVRIGQFRYGAAEEAE